MSEVTIEFTRKLIEAYAEASGDRNPIHLDDESARAAGLPGVIAHGMLQMGILAGLAVREAGDVGRLKSLGCRFSGMVRPGERVTFGAERHGDRIELWARLPDGRAVLTKAAALLD